MRKVVGTLAGVLLLVGCGANPATPSPTARPSPSPESTNLAQAAVTALTTQHEAWQYTATTYESGSPNRSRTITGTQSDRIAHGAELDRDSVGQAGYALRPLRH